MSVEMHTTTCCVCNVVFAMTQLHQERLQESKKSFFCPNGHSQSYLDESAEEKLKRANQRLDDARTYLDAERRSNSALRGVITKMKREH